MRHLWCILVANLLDYHMYQGSSLATCSGSNTLSHSLQVRHLVYSSSKQTTLQTYTTRWVARLQLCLYGCAIVLSVLIAKLELSTGQSYRTLSAIRNQMSSNRS